MLEISWLVWRWALSRWGLILWYMFAYENECVKNMENVVERGWLAVEAAAAVSAFQAYQCFSSFVDLYGSFAEILVKNLTCTRSSWGSESGDPLLARFLYTCVCVRMCVRVCIREHKHSRTHALTGVRTHAQTHAHACTNTKTCIHTFTETCTRTRAHTHMNVPKCWYVVYRIRSTRYICRSYFRNLHVFEHSNTTHARVRSNTQL